MVPSVVEAVVRFRDTLLEPPGPGAGRGKGPPLRAVFFRVVTGRRAKGAGGRGIAPALCAGAAGARAMSAYCVRVSCARPARVLCKRRPAAVFLRGYFGAGGWWSPRQGPGASPLWAAPGVRFGQAAQLCRVLRPRVVSAFRVRGLRACARKHWTRGRGCWISAPGNFPPRVRVSVAPGQAGQRSGRQGVGGIGCAAPAAGKGKGRSDRCGCRSSSAAGRADGAPLRVRFGVCSRARPQGAARA